MEPGSQLCKRLHAYLAAKLPMRWLVHHGWFDFLNADRPRVDDPIEIAGEAFLYLCVRDDICDELPNVLAGVIGFLKEATGSMPSAREVSRLRVILQTIPVDPDSVRKWFRKAY